MRIYLDDERQTPEGFTHRAYNPQQVFELLIEAEKNKVIVECLSLDHDLGNPPGEPTGYDVLLWIEEQVYTRNYSPPLTILIHTDNASARSKMLAAREQIYRKANNCQTQ